MAQAQAKAPTAIERARQFAGLGGTGEIVKYDPALLDAEVPEGLVPEGIADFADVEGQHPALPLKTTLKEKVGTAIIIYGIEFVPTPPQFLEEKRKRGLNASDVTAVVRFRGQDGAYYVAVAGNNRVMEQANSMANMLARAEGIRTGIISYQSTGGTGYCFGKP